MALAPQYYLCNRCRFRTPMLSKITDHLLEHSSTKQPPRFPYFDCFDRLKPLKCPSCDFNTDSVVLLRYHVVHNHDQQQFTWNAKLKMCKKCRFSTHSNYLWIRHGMYRTCNGKKASKGKKKNIVLKKRNAKWYPCEKCDYRTLCSSNLKNHVINNHTPLEEIDWQHCNTCSAKFKTLTGLKKHQKGVHASAMDHLHCPECDYSTPIKEVLKNHINNKHTRSEEIKWVECNECGAKFKNIPKLRRHMVKHSTTEKQYKCDQCPFETHRKDSLKTHIIQRHLKKEQVKCEKLFKCEHCDYSYKYKRGLKHHVLVKHSIDGEVFQCKECDYNSRLKLYLTRHITAMHKRSKFICEDCSFVTKTKQKLQLHMFNRHKVYIEGEKLNCDHCSYFCFNKQYLKKHLKYKHEIGDKIVWYKCDKCDYKNQEKRSLTSHMFTVHGDGKPLECDQCDYKAGCRVSMWSHKKNHKIKK